MHLVNALPGVAALGLIWGKMCIRDRCKAVQKDMRITNIRLLEKSGGKSGYIAEE